MEWGEVANQVDSGRLFLKGIYLDGRVNVVRYIRGWWYGYVCKGQVRTNGIRFSPVCQGEQKACQEASHSWHFK